MISIRTSSPFSDEETFIAIEGDEEELMYGLLVSDLGRMEWEVWVSRDGEDYWELGEDEDE